MNKTIWEIVIGYIRCRPVYDLIERKQIIAEIQKTYRHYSSFDMYKCVLMKCGYLTEYSPGIYRIVKHPNAYVKIKTLRKNRLMATKQSKIGHLNRFIKNVSRYFCTDVTVLIQQNAAFAVSLRFAIVEKLLAYGYDETAIFQATGVANAYKMQKSKTFISQQMNLRYLAIKEIIADIARTYLSNAKYRKNRLLTPPSNNQMFSRWQSGNAMSDDVADKLLPKGTLQ